MKILYLHLFPLWGNGSGVFLRELSGQLQERHEVAIVAPDTRSLPGIKMYPVHAPQDGVFVGHPELPSAKRFSDMSGKELGEIFTTYLWTTIQAVNEFKPDVIHVFHTAFLPGIARILKSLFGVRYVITTHGSDLNYLEKDTRFMELLHEANKHARFITACSSFTKSWYIKMFGSEVRNKSSIVVGGVNLSQYKQDPKKIMLIDAKYNLAGKKVVLFTGRLTKHKGVIYLIRAAQKINGTVLIIGDGPERKNIEAEITKKNITNVILAGYIKSDDPLYHAYYERADVYVAPSVWDEPLGLTILEAMAAHKPVVATRKGGILSIIRDKINGYLIAPRSSSEIANQVNTLLRQDNVRETVGERAYKTVVDKFNWETIAGRFEKLYATVIGTVKPHPISSDRFFHRLFAAREKVSF